MSELSECFLVTFNSSNINLSTRTTSSLSSVHKSFGQQMRIRVFGSSRTLLRADARSLIDCNRTGHNVRETKRASTLRYTPNSTVISHSHRKRYWINRLLSLLLNRRVLYQLWQFDRETPWQSSVKQYNMSHAHLWGNILNQYIIQTSALPHGQTCVTPSNAPRFSTVWDFRAKYKLLTYLLIQ